MLALYFAWQLPQRGMPLIFQPTPAYFDFILLLPSYETLKKTKPSSFLHALSRTVTLLHSSPFLRLFYSVRLNNFSPSVFCLYYFLILSLRTNVDPSRWCKIHNHFLCFCSKGFFSFCFILFCFVLFLHWFYMASCS